MPHELTARQRETLEAIRFHIQSTGYPPTGRELAKLLNVCQTAAVNLVGALEHKGFIRRVSGAARTITIVK